MCWNAEVSLNTFVFSGFVLLLVFYNNQYTQYKIQELNDVWVYIFALSAISMQLIEFFIWKNIDDPFYNMFFTMLSYLLVWFQPITSIMLIKNNTILKHQLLFYYFMISVFFIIYRSIMYFMNNKKIVSTVSLSNHLQWNIIKGSGFYIHFLVWSLWLFFYCFSFFYNRQYMIVSMGVLLLLITNYSFFKDGSIPSVWCWMINGFALYFAAYLLFYLPFMEKR